MIDNDNMTDALISCLYYAKWSAQGEVERFNEDFEKSMPEDASMLENEKAFSKGLGERFDAWKEKQPCILTELQNHWATQND